MHEGSFLKHYLVSFVVPNLHVLEKLLFVPLDQCKEVSVLLQDVLRVVLKHELSEGIDSNYLGQCLSAQHMTDNLLLRLHCHLPHRIIVKRVQPE